MKLVALEHRAGLLLERFKKLGRIEFGADGMDGITTRWLKRTCSVVLLLYCGCCMSPMPSDLCRIAPSAPAIFEDYETALAAKRVWRSSRLARELTSLCPRHPKVRQLEEQLRAVPLVLDLGGGVTMELIRIPAGEFRMGSPSSESGRHDDEGPVHTVRFSRPFYVGKYEVTQAQWRAVMGTTVRQQRDGANREGSLYGEGGDQPMYYVSWYEACEFCRRVAKKTGAPIRLPTEAEWEYACRAGTTTPYPWGASMGTSGTVANVADRRAKRDHPDWTTADFDDGYPTTAPVGKHCANACAG